MARWGKFLSWSKRGVRIGFGRHKKQVVKTGCLMLLVAGLALGAVGQITREEFDALSKDVNGLRAKVAWLTVRVKQLEPPARIGPTPRAADKPQVPSAKVDEDLRFSRGSVIRLPASRERYRLYADESARKLYKKAAAAGDTTGIIQLVAAGRLRYLLPGERVLVIEVHGLLGTRAEVRILDGAWKVEIGLLDMALLDAE